jgi:hypothetical protein
MNVLRREHASLVEWSLPDTKLPENPVELLFLGEITSVLAFNKIKTIEIKFYN